MQNQNITVRKSKKSLESKKINLGIAAFISILSISLFLVSIFLNIAAETQLIADNQQVNFLLSFVNTQISSNPEYISKLELISSILMYLSIFALITSVYIIFTNISKKSDQTTMRLIFVFLIASIPILMILIKAGVM